jgi:hypothetical protein
MWTCQKMTVVSTSAVAEKDKSVRMTEVSSMPTARASWRY